MRQLMFLVVLTLVLLCSSTASTMPWTEADCLHGYNFTDSADDAGTGGLDGVETGTYAYEAIDTGYGIHLDGSTGYVNFANRHLPTGDWTLAIRFKPDTLPATDMTLFVLKDTELIINDNAHSGYESKLNLYGSMSGDNINTWSVNAIPTSGYTEAMIVYDGTTDTSAVLYINNVFNSTDTDASGDVTYTGARENIGAHDSSKYFDGIIDYVYVWDDDLTDAERNDFYDNIRATSSAPVISNTVPTQETNSYENDPKTFSLDIDQAATVTWYLDTVLKETDTNVTSASYIDSTAAIGTARNVTAIATNGNGTDSYEWDWDVLENTVDVEVTYYNPDNLSYNIIWDISNATAGLQSINVSYNDTQNGNTYKGYIDLGTDELLGTLVATGDNQTLWINTTNVSDNTFFVNEASGGAPDTLFEYWDGIEWTEANAALDAIYFPYVWWWTNLEPNYLQTDVQATLNITNSGTAAGTPYMKLNASTPATVDIWVDDDNAKDGDSVTLNTSWQVVGSELAVNGSVELWAWGGFYGIEDDIVLEVHTKVE